MPRKARQEQAGGTHWVWAISPDSAPLAGLLDCFEEVLGRVVTRCGWELLASALRDEGYVLLLRTPEPNLSLGMQSLQRKLVAWRKLRFPHRKGSLFSQRFASELVSGEASICAARRRTKRWLGSGGTLREGLREVRQMAKPLELEPSHSSDLTWRSKLQRALNWYGVSAEELASFKKSARCKKVIGAWIYSGEAVKLVDLAEALSMGHASALSRSLAEVDANCSGLREELARLEIAMQFQANTDSEK